MKLFREKSFIKSGIKSGIVIILAIALFSLPVSAQETHLNGFGGVTIINPTGTMIFDTNIMRSEALSQDNLVLAYDMSTTVSVDDDILLYDFSEQGNHGTRYPGVAPLSYNETSSADATVDEQNPTTNYGSETTVIVRTSSVGDARIFTTWNLSSIPSDAIIQDAQMVLYKISSSGSFPRTYDAEKASSSWTEGGITWDTQPAVTGSAISITISADVVTEFNWSIVDFVQDWVDGTQTNYGLRIKDQTEGSVSIVISGFDSRENTNDPYLTINYTIPESEIPTIASTFGQASDFDGYDDYVNTSLDISPDNFTLVAVVNPDTAPTSPDLHGIMMKRDTATEWLLGMNFGRNIRFQGFDNVGALTVNVASNIAIPLDSFSLVGMTWNGSTVSFWINGQEAGSGDRTGTQIADTSITISIGVADPDDTDWFWDGPIDEVLIFSDAMDNASMVALTTIQHQLVIGGGSASVPQRFGGLILALPWLILVGIMFTMFYIAFLAWRKSLKGEW